MFKSLELIEHRSLEDERSRRLLLSRKTKRILWYVSKPRHLSRTPRIDLQFVRNSREKQRVWVGGTLH
jgi:hypothetical protein